MRLCRGAGIALACLGGTVASAAESASSQALRWQMDGGPPGSVSFHFQELVQLTKLGVRWQGSSCALTLSASVDQKSWRPVYAAPAAPAARSPNPVLAAVGQYFRLGFGACAGGDAPQVAALDLAAEVPSPADLVNIFIGTNNDGASFSRGNQYPGIYTPWGMDAFSVGTESLQGSWFYDYKDQALTGIKLTHQVTQWGSDFGAFDIMPMTGTPSADYAGRASPYQRANELARPYYYRNTLDRYGITFQVAPADRGGILQFDYPAGATPLLVLHDAEAPSAAVAQAGTRAIQGSFANGGITTYFRAEFDRAIASLTTSGDMAAALSFAPATGANSVTMKVATSYISIQQAADNLATELAGQTLASLTAAAKQQWNDRLRRIIVDGKAADEMTFYSSLYRVFGFPKTHWEHIGQDPATSQYFSPFDNQVHQGRKLWTGHGFWDTYRTVWPLMTVLFPTLTGEMLDGWVNSYKDGGWSVRWSKPGYWDCMNSTHLDVVFADAFVKGIQNFDYQTAYQSSLKNAMVVSQDGGQGRSFLDRALFLGYSPSQDATSADAAGSRTFDDSVSDFGISVFAKALGKGDDYAYFRNRSLAYTNLWDPSTRFFRGRFDSGMFASPTAAFDPFVWGYAWTEGDAWQYRVAPMHDGAGLVGLFGGRPQLEKALDEILAADSHFEVGSYGSTIHEMSEAQAIGQRGYGQFNIGNEPVEHFLHMYAYAGRPSKTQFWVRRVLSELYSSGYGDGGGYPGDEDEGQLSAWYVMNAMGFYSAAPGHPEYILDSPVFRSVAIKLENGRTFQIAAPGNDDQHVYVGAATLDGQPYDLSYISHRQIMAGGVLNLAMSATPTAFGESAASIPSSVTELGAVPAYQPSLSAGATVTGSGENPPNETLDRLVDTQGLTKWLVFANQAWFDVQLAAPAAANCYTMMSANDVPERDPKAWRLDGSVDGQTWQPLDQQRNVRWDSRLQAKLFCFDNQTAFSHYRVTVSENAGGAETQLAEFELRRLER